ncbi:beta strand repeat-containing protein [Diaphorobacter nitroreducens]|uniref:beta strand repeat-containing protein n=1 Tax=Diaphorobacter nitroreducens TaxID=164759 RepID=UPI0035AF57C4
MTYFTTGAQLQAALNALPNTKTGNFVAFDSFFYGQQYMADYQGTLSPIEHFVQIGAARGYKPNATFDPTYYANAFADLKGKGFDSADLLYHFMQYGLDEGRTPNAALATFDGTAYLAANPDVAAYVNANLAQFGGSATNGALAHYVKFGAAEGRTAPGTSVSNGQTFTLTTGADNFTGTAGNDTFTAAQVATGDTWTVGDVLDGGAGNDTLNVTETTLIATPTAATVKNIETANLISGATVSVDASGWTGLTALNVTATGGTTATGVTAAATTAVDLTSTGAAAGAETVVVNGGSTVSVTAKNNVADTIVVGGTTAAAGAVTVTSTGGTANGDTAGTITVTGGSKVTVTQNAGNAAATGNNTVGGAVTVNGNASTTEVTVNQTKTATGATATATTAGVVGFAAGLVTVADKNSASLTDAGTIATVTLSSWAGVDGNADGDTLDAGEFSSVNSGALTSLNLSGVGGALAVTAGGLTTPAVTTLGLNVNGLTSGQIRLDADYTTLNLASSTAASTIADLSAGGVKTLNISGDAKVTLTAQTMGALTDVVVTNTAGASLGTALAAGVNFTGGAGADSVTLTDEFTKAITLGAGDDTLTIVDADADGVLAGTGGSVAAGDGTDTIVLTGATAAAVSANATFNSKFTGFEALTVTAGGAATINLAGVNNVATVNTAGQTGALVLNSFVSGGTVNLTGATGGAGGDVQAVITNAALNAADVVNFKLTNSTNNVVDFGKITAAGVETINISTVDAGTAANTAATIDVALLTADTATKIVVSGNNGLDLSASVAAKVTTFDASGVVGNSADDTAANLAVKYTSDNNTATATVSITGGAGNDTLIGNAAKDTIVGGAGNDSITGGTGVDTLTGGAGVDTFVFAAGDAGITGAEKITDFSIALGGDKLDLATTTLIANVTAANVTGAVGGAVDVTATVKDGIITLGGADVALVDTVGEIKAIFELLDADNSAEVGAIVLNGQTYVITDAASGGGADTVNDIIQLVGVTGAVSLSTTDAANSIWIA